MKKILPSNKMFSVINRTMGLVGLLLCATFASAQTSQKVKWTEMSHNHATFYEVQKDFNHKWRGPLREMAREKHKAKKENGKEKETEAAGYEVYKRWESYMKPRVYPSGDMTLPSTNYSNYLAWKNSYRPQTNIKAPVNNISAASNWTSLGPVGSPSGPSPYSMTGAGRVNFVRFDPNNSNTMYLGTPDGGLWKSTDAGTTWTTNTDFLSAIGCSDMVIDPSNTNNMYLATGDLEGDRNSIGVLKSTDGGATWNATAMAFAPSNGYVISRLLINPSNPLNMIIATNGGIFRTTDGWATFKQTQCCQVYKDMEFKPGDPNTVYAAGQTFWKSTDNGVTWTKVTAGLPSTNVQRIALGVSAANSGYVYALIGKASDQSFLGMYRSTNSGTSFSLRASSPNLLGYEANGSDVTAGQAFYDLSVVVSPTNAEIVTTGGVNHWQSVNGGTNWTNKSVWDAGQVHADVHELDYLPGSSTTMFSCNDGGIFKSTNNGTNWTDISHNLTIAQVVGIGLSASVSTTIVDGEQDNGTNLKSGSAWHNIFGGDGGACFIDYTTDKTIYIQYVEGDFNRSDDGGVSTTSIASGLPSGFDFYSQWHQDPVTSTKLYVGGTPRLYTSTNRGTSWTGLATPPGSGTISNFAIAPSNHAIIYAVKENAISKSTNSGAAFTNITGTLPTASAAISNVAVSDADPNKVWVTFSGYNASYKVFASTDGGTTWTNISTGLPNLPVNTILHQKGSANDALYLGADIGVYYFDNTLSSWVPFMTNLPHNSVRELEIFYPSGKIRAATYGRGVWESNIYTSSTPNANLAALKLSSGTLTPVFSIDSINYTAKVTNTTTSVTITPTASDPQATIKVNGTTVASGTASASLPLVVGPNTITTVVTAQDGITTKTYTVTVTRAASSNTYLSNLKINGGSIPLSPAFNYATGAYTASVPNATTSIKVTPLTADVNATVKINGTLVKSGTASAALPLKVGSNTVNAIVTAQNGTSARLYAITVTRAPSANAKLASLALSSGTLSPAFATGTTSYTATIGAASVTVTPTTSDATARVKVNGTAVTSGSASGAIALTLGSNTITTVVTAQDGTTTDTYTITVTRLSNNANLANLKINSGNVPLSPAFNYNTTSYTASVANAITSVTVTPTASDANATIKVNGTTVASGTQSTGLPLATGPNTITAMVTAQDGATTKTYTVTVTRATGPVATPVVYNPPISKLAPNDGIVVQQALSPNGDGVNDHLIIEGITAYPDNKLMIINRNGNLIYEAVGYDNHSKVFDGRSNKTGAKQLPGTYFYSLDYRVKGVNRHKTGYIVLKY